MTLSANTEYPVTLPAGPGDGPDVRETVTACKKARIVERLRWAAISTSAGCLFYLGQIRSWTSEQNRYHYFWEPQDSLALVFNILLLGIVIFILANVARSIRSNALRSLAKYLFLLFLADSTISSIVSLWIGVGFTRKYDPVFWLGWSVIAVVVFFAKAKLWRAAVGLCLILSPLPLLLIPQILLFSRWDLRLDTSVSRLPPKRPPDHPRPQVPVLIFVFDEWSYDRTFKGSDISEEFPNLRKFASTATVFHNARSPAPATLISLPRIIFQSAEGILHPSGGQLYWQTPRNRKQLCDIPTVFDGLVAEGYEVHLLGFYHPYEILLAERGILSRSYPNDPNYREFFPQVGYFFVANLRFLTDPLSRILWRWSDSRLFSHHWYKLSCDFEEQARSLVETAHEGTCLFIHWPLPHGPFVLDAEGRYVGPYDSTADRMAGTAEDYHRHLQRLDRVIGEILVCLERKGLLDKALLILTSDHSWRRDPDLLSSQEPPDLCHVPLLVKHPGQDYREDRHERIYLWNIAGLLRPVTAAGTPGAVAGPSAP